MEEWLAEYWALVVGIASIAGTIVYNSRKVEVDKDANIFKAWKDLLESHQTQIATLTSEIRDLKDRLGKAEERIRSLEQDIRDRDDTITGLKRAIAQNSQSTAVQLKRVKKTANSTDRHVQTLEGENAEEHRTFGDSISRLNAGIGDNSIGSDVEDGK